MCTRPDDGWQMSRLDSVGGVPLGIIDDVPYETASIDLTPGQTLVLYTDGITEARCPEGHMFGIEGIERSLTTCTGEPDCVIHHITDALKDHERTVRPDDDQTIVVMNARVGLRPTPAPRSTRSSPATLPRTRPPARIR